MRMNRVTSHWSPVTSRQELQQVAVDFVNLLLRALIVHVIVDGVGEFDYGDVEFFHFFLCW